MLISQETLRSVTYGALNIRLEDDYYHFYRFNDAQMDYYREKNSGFYLKSKATAGVNLDFYTDSDNFGFDYKIESGSSRKFYHFDIYVDGILVHHCGENPMWIMNGRVDAKIPDGEHQVTLWLPNLSCAMLKNITLDDGASVRPVGRKTSMICWGDSITQGYDAIFPSLAYPNRLAKHFDAEMINQAIGGERFVPGILGTDLGVKPDIITIAYGTNDWSGRTREEFIEGTDKFLEGIAAQYPESKVFVITPIWRGDNARITKFGTFSDARQYVADKAASLGFSVIDGIELTPHYYEFYSDLRLHPNDLGFGEYTRNLIAAMEKTL